MQMMQHKRSIVMQIKEHKRSIVMQTITQNIFCYANDVTQKRMCICNPAKRRLNGRTVRVRIPPGERLLSRWVPIFKRACNPI